jgi:squalene-associated FAD-dependent desaturase
VSRLDRCSRDALTAADDRVHILGGGLAGLAAATVLLQHGVPVTLLEARDRLGGRASSFVDAETGETVDNCQHVSMGCCTALQHFCRTVGVAPLFRDEKELTFIDPDGGRSTLRAAPLPAPLHLAPAFARLRYLTFREKLQLARGLRALARLRPEDVSEQTSFLDWLTAQRQSPRVIERFWDVVLVSALSESLDRIDVRYAQKVFVDGFLRHRDGWRVQTPVVPLDDIYGRPVLHWLKSHGGDVRLNAAVRRLRGTTGGVTTVALRDGQELPVVDVILAVPPHRVADLLPPEIAHSATFTAVSHIDSAPITSVHVWFDRPVLDLDHAVLIGRLSQWVFTRPGRAAGENSSPSACQVVVSASRALRGLPQEELRDRVLAELTAIWPAAGAARVEHWRVVTEHRAVFSAVPGIDALRPPQQSSVPNLQLAGDWTATGWPATMEGAVRSGYLAASNVLRRRGIVPPPLPPDLPTARLSRWLFGLAR